MCACLHDCPISFAPHPCIVSFLRRRVVVRAIAQRLNPKGFACVHPHGNWDFFSAPRAPLKHRKEGGMRRDHISAKIQPQSDRIRLESEFERGPPWIRLDSDSDQITTEFRSDRGQVLVGSRLSSDRITIGFCSNRGRVSAGSWLGSG